MKKIINAAGNFNIGIRDNNLKFFRCWLKLIPSFLMLGFTPSEFITYGFVNKNLHNQKKFISNRDRIKLIKKHNKDIVNSKSEFNKEFGEYINRKWILVTQNNYNEFKKFINNNGRKYISKPDDGAEGRGVELVIIEEDTDYKEMHINNINKLFEEYIIQNEKMSYWNKDSVNTIRIVTSYIDEQFKVIGCGIRVGERGNHLDNIGQGGAAAIIDYETGIVQTELINRFHNRGQTDKIKGFEIPYWEEVKRTLPEIVRKNKDLKVVGWDIAITNSGIELLEGNSSMGLSIVQGIDLIGKKHLIIDYI